MIPLLALLPVLVTGFECLGEGRDLDEGHVFEKLLHFCRNDHIVSFWKIKNLKMMVLG